MTPPAAGSHGRSVAAMAAVTTLGGLLLLTVAGSAMAALPGSIPTCGRPGPGLGTISGRLIADSAGIRLSRGVFVSRPWCDTQADANGNYTLSGLPPGTYEFEVGDLGVRRVAPVTVTVRAGETTRVDVHLKPENRVLDCLADPACAPLLAPLDDQTRMLLPDREQLLEVAVRTTIAISGFTRTAELAPGALCVGIDYEDQTRPLPTSVLNVLRIRLPEVHQPSECRKVPDGAGVGLLRVGDAGWAWSYRVSLPEAVGGRASGTSDYSPSQTTGEGWACEYERDEQGWRPRLCRGTWIS